MFNAKIRKLLSLDQRFPISKYVASILIIDEWTGTTGWYWLTADWWIVRSPTHSSVVCTFSGPSYVALSAKYQLEVMKMFKSQNDGVTSYLRPEAQWHDGVLEGRVSVHVRRDTCKKYYKHVELKQFDWEYEYLVSTCWQSLWWIHWIFFWCVKTIWLSMLD